MRIKCFLIWKTWIPFTHGCFVPRLVETGQVHGSGEEDFWISWMYFRYFLIISPWKYGEALNLNKLESSSPKDALCQVWLKLVQWFWRRRFFNFVNVFSLFRNYFPLEKGGALHLNKLESPQPKDALCQVWLKLAKWFWTRRWKCEKFTTTPTTTTTTTTDNGQILIRKAHLSLWLRWAKNRITRGLFDRVEKL